MFRARRRAEDVRVRSFLAAIRATEHGGSPPRPARTDTVLLPRIVATQTCPPGGWAVAG